jgi:hypothetical protein
MVRQAWEAIFHVSYIVMTFLVPRPLDSRDQGRFLLERFIARFPDHIPQKCGNDEPLKHVFDERSLDHVLQLWGAWHFIAERGTHPWSLINVGAALRSPYTPLRSIGVHLAFDDNRDSNNSAVRQFVYEVSDGFKAVYASVHISPVPYNKTDPTRHTSIYKMIKYVQTKRLNKHIMHLFWLTVFGPQYVDLFGKDKLLSTPASAVHQLPYGGIGVELTSGIENTPESEQEFILARDSAERHLDSNAFYDKFLPVDHIYNTPDFGIPDDIGIGRRERSMKAIVKGQPAYEALMDVLDPRRRPGQT